MAKKQKKGTMAKTIEQKVADTILQETFTIQIGAKQYNVQPISYGTLIRISGIISTLPTVSDNENIFAGALKYGAHADKLAEIVALCILNRRNTSARYSRRYNPLKPRLVTPGLQEVKQEILYNCTIGQVGEIIRTLFNKMELADFFGVMVSLSGVNLTAETATTASGQPLEE